MPRQPGIFGQTPAAVRQSMMQERIGQAQAIGNLGPGGHGALAGGALGRAGNAQFSSSCADGAHCAKYSQRYGFFCAIAGHAGGAGRVDELHHPGWASRQHSGDGARQLSLQRFHEGGPSFDDPCDDHCTNRAALLLATNPLI